MRGVAAYDGTSGILAWMRMMGSQSVGYHQRTLLGRGNDPVSSFFSAAMLAGLPVSPRG